MKAVVFVELDQGHTGGGSAAKRPKALPTSYQHTLTNWAVQTGSVGLRSAAMVSVSVLFSPLDKLDKQTLVTNSLSILWPFIYHDKNSLLQALQKWTYMYSVIQEHMKSFTL